MTKTRINKLMAAFLAVVMTIAFFAYIPQMEVKAISCRKDGFDKSRYTLTGNMAEDVAIIAKSQKGRTRSDFGYTEAWCDEFCADCIENAGGSSDIVGHGGYVIDFERIMTKQKGAVQVSSPQVGDLVFFGTSHVEIVTKVQNGVVYCAGGNNGGGSGKCAGERTVNSVNSGLGGTSVHYVRPNYNESSVSKPSWAWISATGDRTSFAVGEEIHFWMSADTSSSPINYYFIGINKGDERIITEKCYGDYYVSFDEPGNYSVYVSAYNEVGFENSNTIYFDVLKKPSWAWISTTRDRTTFSVDEEVTFTMSADSVESPISYYFIGIDKGDERIITEKCYGEYTMSFDEPGDYSVYVSAYNEVGFVNSNIINFKIVKLQDLPGTPLEYSDVGTDFYAIISQISTKQLLTNKTDDAIFQEYSDKTDQYWFFSYNDNGSYTIETYDRTKALDVTGGSIDNGTNVRLYEKNGSLAQQWYLYWADGGLYFKSALGNCVLDFNGASGDGANADLWEFNGTIAQVMEFYKIDLDNNMPVDMGDYFFAKIINKTNGKALSNTDNNIVGEDAKYTEEQTWCFIRMNNGSYKIMSYYDVDSSINIDGFGNKNATNISIDTDNGNTAQRFFLYEIDEDIYIKPLCSDKVFDMNTDTLNMETWSYIKGADSKGFSIEKLNEEKYVKLEIASKPDKLVYNAGEKLDTKGLTIKQIYETGRSFTTSSGFTVDKSVLKLGDSEVTVTYEGKSATFNITVKSLLGDINNDGEFNVSDAVILQKWLLAVPNTNLANWKAADFCEDDRLDVFDLCLMKRMLVEKS